jgi:hypothetical protein
VGTPGVGDAGETLKAIADDRAACVAVALGEPAIEVAQRLVTRRSFKRTGFPSAVVSTAVNASVNDPRWSVGLPIDGHQN